MLLSKTLTILKPCVRSLLPTVWIQVTFVCHSMPPWLSPAGLCSPFPNTHLLFPWAAQLCQPCPLSLSRIPLNPVHHVNPSFSLKFYFDIISSSKPSLTSPGRTPLSVPHGSLIIPLSGLECIVLLKLFFFFRPFFLMSYELTEREMCLYLYPWHSSTATGTYWKLNQCLRDELFFP